MQIVIDIPENTYKQIQALARNNYFEHDICGNSMRRIANGTTLPKGHGRLIDESKIKKCGWDFTNHHAKTNAPTIIEADGSEEE